MAYIGKTPEVGNITKLDSIAGFQNGVTTSFQLFATNKPYSPESAAELILVKNGLVLDPGVDYSVNGSFLSINPAPLANDVIWILALGKTRYTGIPSDGSVTNEKIAVGGIEYEKLSGDAISTILGNIITFGI